MAFSIDPFLRDLATFVSFETIVCENIDAFKEAQAWIRAFFDAERTEIEEIACGRMTSMIIRPRGSERPRLLGDGHIEVVPGAAELFRLRVDGDGIARGRGVADMKTQCLMMMYVLRAAIADGTANDFWIAFTEDEEIGSERGAAIVADRLWDRGAVPKAVFAPDGGPDFAYVEKEKGMLSFVATAEGVAAHASRPYLARNAIESMLAFAGALRERFPNPTGEDDWRLSASITEIEGGEARNKIPDSCRAGFDFRLTETEDIDELEAEIRTLASKHSTTIDVEQRAPAAYYPKENWLAARFIGLLREISGTEPRILRSAGASNGRIYQTKDDNLPIFMSSPRMGGAHAREEYVDTASLGAYYALVRRTVQLV